LLTAVRFYHRHNLSIPEDPELSRLAAVELARALELQPDNVEALRLQAQAKVTGVKLALVGASHPAGEVSCEVRHGGKYEQRLVDGTIDVQLLTPLVSIHIAMLERLEPDEELGIDSPDDGPDLLPFSGRGVGGGWEVAVVGGKGNVELGLTQLTEIQVWIDYQFRQ
jgi:hypothetical protein